MKYRQRGGAHLAVAGLLLIVLVGLFRAYHCPQDLPTGGFVLQWGVSKDLSLLSGYVNLPDKEVTENEGRDDNPSNVLHPTVNIVGSPSDAFPAAVNDDDHDTVTWKLKQRESQKLLQEKCEDIYKSTASSEILQPSFIKNLLVDDRHKFIYCPIPNVGCTSLKQVLGALSGNVSTTFPVHFGTYLEETGVRSLGSFPLNEALHKLHNYTTYMFVRHPFERILSGYKSQFQEYSNYTKFFQMKYGSKIVKTYRVDPSSMSLSTGSDVQFGEFLKYLAETNDSFDEHWARYTDYCHPCFIHYDYIGKLETLNIDLTHIIGEKVLLGNPATRKYANVSVSSADSGRASYKELRTSYSKIPKQTIKALYDVYWKDFELFGYSPDIFLSEEKGAN